MFKASLALTFISSSWKFLQLFELWKILYSEVAQKITKKLYFKFPGKRPPEGTCGWPGGPPPSQKARWRGPAPGRATHPPGWAPCPLMAFLLSLSLSFCPKTRVLPLVSLFLLFLSSYLQSPLLTTCLSWFLGQVLLGMWLLHPSN